VAENLQPKGSQWKLQNAKFAENFVQQFTCICYISDTWADMTSHKTFFNAMQRVPNFTHITEVCSFKLKYMFILQSWLLLIMQPNNI